METKFAGLTVNKEEVVLQIQVEPNTKRKVGAFRLVGCYLIANIISLHSNEKYYGKSRASYSGCSNPGSGGEKVFVSIFSYHGFGKGFERVTMDF